MTGSIAFKPLTKSDVAEVLGVSVRSVEIWVNEKTLPAPKRIGSRVYWHPTVFYTWLEHQLTAEDAPAITAITAITARLPAEKNLMDGRKSRTSSALSEIETLRSRTQSKIDELLV